MVIPTVNPTINGSLPGMGFLLAVGDGQVAGLGSCWVILDHFGVQSNQSEMKRWKGE